MEDWLARTELLFGKEAIGRLNAARVAVFGLGGVGGYAVEALARSGIGALDLVDGDVVSVTNLNRQILATHETLGRQKTEAAKERVKSIFPACDVKTYPFFYTPSCENLFDLTCYDYVVDAIDMVTAKLSLICRAKEAGVPVISAMGAGNKLDPTALEVADLSETSVCPLARTMRRELKRRGVEHLKVVYSREPPVKHGQGRTPASNAFVPAAAGLILAGEVVKDLLAR